MWVKFDFDAIGAMSRNRFKGLYRDDATLRVWSPIQRITLKFKASARSEYYLNRSQFPLTLSHTRTIFMSQGKTMQSALIDCTPGKGRSGHGIHYTAASRVVSGTALRRSSDIVVNSAIQMQMAHMRKNCDAIDSLAILPLHEQVIGHRDESFVVFAQNIR